MDPTVVGFDVDIRSIRLSIKYSLVIEPLIPCLGRAPRLRSERMIEDQQKQKEH